MIDERVAPRNSKHAKNYKLMIDSIHTYGNKDDTNFNARNENKYWPEKFYLIYLFLQRKRFDKFFTPIILYVNYWFENKDKILLIVKM